MHSFRGVGDRNHRQGNFSTSAILYSAEQCTRLDSSLLHVGNISFRIMHWCCTTQGLIRNFKMKLPNHYLPVFVVYDSIDDRIVDSGGFCYYCRDCLGVWRQDVGMAGSDKTAAF